MIESFCDQDGRWRCFINRAQQQPGAPETIKGFLMALHDCCVQQGREYNVPEWVKSELASLVSLDPESIKLAQLQQRISRLIANLKLPHADDRSIERHDSLARIEPLVAPAHDSPVQARRGCA